MRRVDRLKLDPEVQKDLDRRQNKANAKRRTGTLNPAQEWDNARPTQKIKKALTTLQKMMGPHERCMYCVDSHGSDIEHFWPKTTYPDKVFLWTNMLLCCTECGRFKGGLFPLTEAGLPLLINPTEEDPWIYLDFDPDTGNVVARFDTKTNDETPKGKATVDLLQLDRREALATGYRRTFLRLSKVVEKYLEGEVCSADELIEEMQTMDDHGLLGWCFLGTGRSVPPFYDLHLKHFQLWVECEAIVRRL